MVERVTIKPRPSVTDKNTLTVSLPGIRRLHVFLEPSADVHAETADIWWSMSAWATLATPLGPNKHHVHLAPSLLTIAPLGASLMHVACAFWPTEPAASALHVKFSTRVDGPLGDSQAWGIGDTAPHDFFGFFAAPFGHPRAFDRLVEPLPDDPELIHRLELERHLPPPVNPHRPHRSST